MDDDCMLYLFTDGAGYTDGFGGWAYMITDRTMTQCLKRGFGCATDTTVDIMEMTAAIEGLKNCLDVADRKACELIRHLSERGKPPRVIWYGDRESMIKSALGEYARSNSPELWQLFELYERQLDLVPRHIKLDLGDESDLHRRFAAVDMDASTMRITAKEYYNSTTTH